MGINVDCGIFIDFMLQEILNALKKRQGTPIRMDVGENEEKILELIRKDKWISAKNLAGHVGLSARQVERIITRLREKGLLARIGPAKGGYWNVLDY